MTGSAMHSTNFLAELNAIDSVWLRQAYSGTSQPHADEMFMWLFWFCTFWFVLLMTLMVVFVVRYRRKKGAIAPRSASHNTTLEIAWTLIPSLFLVYIFFKGFWGYMDKSVVPADAIEMNLTGFRWSWRVEYPNGAESNLTATIGARPVPVFYMPAERPVKFRMNSSDVMHSFWVPDFRAKFDLLPNRYTNFWFSAKNPMETPGHRLHPSSQADELAAQGPGIVSAPYIPELAGVPYTDHWVFCAEYCGTEHSEMAAIIRIVPEDAYNRWLTTIGDGNKTPVELGRSLYVSKGCVSCHSIDGSPNTGPTWKGVYGQEVQFTSGGKAIRDENYIRESILVPGAHIVQGYSNQMSSYQGLVTEKQLDSLIAFIKALGDPAAAGDAAPDAAPATAPDASGAAPAAAPQ